MNDLNEVYKRCETVIDLVFSAVGLVGDNKESKNNLLLSVYLNFVKQVFSAPENKKLLDKLSTLNENVSYEDFEKAISEGRTYFQENPINLSGILKNSIHSVLENFITELESKLTTEKVVELKKIVNESF